MFLKTSSWKVPKLGERYESTNPNTVLAAVTNTQSTENVFYISKIVISRVGYYLQTLSISLRNSKFCSFCLLLNSLPNRVLGKYSLGNITMLLNFYCEICEFCLLCINNIFLKWTSLTLVKPELLKLKCKENLKPLKEKKFAMYQISSIRKQFIIGNHTGRKTVEDTKNKWDE